MSKLKNMYDLVYIVNGKVIETPMRNKDIVLCKWKANQLKKSGNYNSGLLQPRKILKP